MPLLYALTQLTLATSLYKIVDQLLTPGDTVQRCHFYMDGIFKLVATDQTTVHVLQKSSI